MPVSPDKLIVPLLARMDFVKRPDTGPCSMVCRLDRSKVASLRAEENFFVGSAGIEIGRGVDLVEYKVTV